MMKLILLVCLIGLVKGMSKEDAKSTLETFGSNCDPPPTDADYEAILTNDVNAAKSAKCFRKCLMKMGNMFTDDGKLDVEQAKSYTGMMYEGKEEVGGEIATKCNEKVSNSDECEAAHEYGMCVLNEMEARGLPIEKFE